MKLIFSFYIVSIDELILKLNHHESSSLLLLYVPAFLWLLVGDIWLEIFIEAWSVNRNMKIIHSCHRVHVVFVGWIFECCHYCLIRVIVSPYSIIKGVDDTSVKSFGGKQGVGSSLQNEQSAQ